MNRRTFLKALATITAATATTDLSAFLPPPAVTAPPVVDWTTWNLVELNWFKGKIRGRLNNQDVSMFPNIMREMCQRFYFDAERGEIRLSSSGHAALSMGGFRYVVDDVDSEKPFVFGCYVKFSEISTPFVATFDDVYVDFDDYAIFDSQLVLETADGARLSPMPRYEHRLSIPEKRPRGWDGALVRGGRGLNVKTTTLMEHKMPFG